MPVFQMSSLNVWLILVLVLGLSACSFEVSDGDPPAAPVVESLSIDGVSAKDGQGPIITEARTVALSAEASAGGSLSHLSIISRKGGVSRQLIKCDNSPCTYAWDVDASDNGIYSFVVEAEDDRGALSLLPFTNSLAIDIR